MTPESAEPMKAYCFPGQGPQDTALIATLDRLPGAGAFLDDVFDATGLALGDLPGLPEAEQEEAVRKNEIASLLTAVYALHDLEALHPGGTPDFLAGYSVGQYVALHAAGCFDRKTLFFLIWRRCLLMNEANAQNPGRMAAIIGLQEEGVLDLCRAHNLQISNFNARGQYTVAGALPGLMSAIGESAGRGAHKSVLINTEGAWHSAFMQPAEEPFRAVLAQTEIASPRIPVIDNVTGDFLPADPQRIREQLVKHLSSAVLWEKGIRTLIGKGVKEFIEVGYGNMLSKFGFFISRDAGFTTSGSILSGCV